MIRKDTWYLMGLAVIVLTYAITFERGGKTTPTAMPRLLPDFDPKEIIGIQILSNGTNSLHVEHAKGSWNLVHPLHYPADPVQPKLFLETISELFPVRHIPVKDDPSKYAEFGLHPPQMVLQLHTAGKPIELHIGNFTPLADKFYVRQPTQPGVFLLPKSSLPEDFQARLPQFANMWRDHTLFQLGNRLLDVDTLAIRSGPRQMTVRRNATNRLWKILLPAPVKRGDKDRIDAAMAKITRWQVEVGGFVTDDPKVDLEPYGLLAPEAEITLGKGTNQLATVQFGHSPTNRPDYVYARILNHTNVVFVRKPWLNDLRARPWDFADHRLVDVLVPGDLARIEVRAGENFSLNQDTNGVWKLLTPTPLPADEDLVLGMLNNLRKMEALELRGEVVADFSKFGLAEPSASYTLRSRGGTNEIHTQISFGSAANDSGDLLYVRRRDEDSVYVVANGTRQSLPSYSYKLRKRQLWNILPKEIIKIMIKDGKKATTLQRNDAGQWTRPGRKLAENELRDLKTALAFLGQFRAIDWVARGSEQFKNYHILSRKKSLTLELLRNGKTETREIHFGGKSQRNHHLYAYATDPLEQGIVIIEFPSNIFQLCEIGLFPLASETPEK